MSALAQLIGTWELTMQHVSMSEPIRGRETYRSILEGAFVEMTRTYDHPDLPDAMAIMSETGSSYFDVRGVVRVFSHRFTESRWSMRRSADGEAFAQRQTATFTTRDLVDGTGEVSHDGGATWQHDYTIRLARLRSAP